MLFALRGVNLLAVPEPPALHAARKIEKTLTTVPSFESVVKFMRAE
jgi:hypothetical protein